MIKGINKQIIEIRCPNDEYFEKALLFVRAEKCSEPFDLIESCARDYCREIAPRQQRRSRKKTAALMLIAAAALLAAGALIAMIVC